MCKNNKLIFYADITYPRWWCVPKSTISLAQKEKKRLYKLEYRARKSEQLNGKKCIECQTPLKGFKIYFCTPECCKINQTKIYLPK
jgi:hypothetical protein